MKRLSDDPLVRLQEARGEPSPVHGQHDWKRDIELQDPTGYGFYKCSKCNARVSALADYQRILYGCPGTTPAASAPPVPHRSEARIAELEQALRTFVENSGDENVVEISRYLLSKGAQP